MVEAASAVAGARMAVRREAPPPSLKAFMQKSMWRIEGWWMMGSAIFSASLTAFVLAILALSSFSLHFSVNS